MFEWSFDTVSVGLRMWNKVPGDRSVPGDTVGRLHSIFGIHHWDASSDRWIPPVDFRDSMNSTFNRSSGEEAMRCSTWRMDTFRFSLVIFSCRILFSSCRRAISSFCVAKLNARGSWSMRMTPALSSTGHWRHRVLLGTPRRCLSAVSDHPFGSLHRSEGASENSNSTDQCHSQSLARQSMRMLNAGRFTYGWVK